VYIIIISNLQAYKPEADDARLGCENEICGKTHNFQTIFSLEEMKA